MTSSSRSDAGSFEPILSELFRAGIAAADPEALTRSACHGLDGDRYVVLAVGKAAIAMARGARAALGSRAERGLIVTNTVAAAPWPVRVAGHPRPNASSEAAAREALALAQSAAAPLLCLMSGGGSSLLAQPAPGLVLADKAAVTSALMAAGAPIGELNAVRKHLSAVKGGRLAAASSMPITTMASSDVAGDSLSVIASGPTVADPTTFADAIDVCRRYRVWPRLPPSVRVHLSEGAAGRRSETPKIVSGDAIVIAGMDTVARAVVALVPGAELAAEPLVGAAEDVAAALIRRASVAVETAWVGYGEATVELGDRVGVGGRALHLALLVARGIAGGSSEVLISGTDGIDGNSPAAGAVVDGHSWTRMLAVGDPQRALAGHDAYPILAAVGATLEPGPTGVNHADLFIVRTARGGDSGGAPAPTL